MNWRYSALQVLLPSPISPPSKLTGKGRFERYNIARNAMGFYSSVGMTAHYTLSENLFSNGLQSVIYTVLRQLLGKHPVLGVTISGTPRQPSWVRLREIDLSKVVQFVEGKDFRQMMEDTHRLPLTGVGSELPLWRVIVMDQGRREEKREIVVGFFFHHAIGDGRSGFAFHMDLSDAFNNLNSTSLDSNVIVKVPKLEMLPSLEEAHPLPLGWLFIASEIIKSILPSFLNSSFWSGPPIRSENNITHIRTISLPSKTINPILQLCRANNVTFTALLSLLIARILGTTYPESTRFRSVQAMSFRRFTETSPRAMVNYVCPYTHDFSSIPKNGYIHCGGEFSWDAVRLCYGDIKVATASSKNQQTGLLKFVDDYEGFFRGKVGKFRDYSFEVSNVGVFDDGQEISEVKRILFSQSSNVIGAAYTFSVATAKGGGTSIVLSWQQDIIEEELAEKVISELESTLNNLINGQIIR
jgi:hypothetical protein